MGEWEGSGCRCNPGAGMKGEGPKPPDEFDTIFCTGVMYMKGSS